MLVYKRILLIFLLLAAVTLGAGVYGFGEQERAVVLDRAEKPAETAADIVVYVCGAVKKPAVVRLKEGARVLDAVELCGGTLTNAAVDKINMAELLKDGMQITVEEYPLLPAAADGSAAAPTAGAQKLSAGAAEGSRININTAGREELDKLPGVGAALAQTIIDHRQKNGRFKQPEDLLEVRGIGKAKFEKLKNRITL